MIYEKKQEDEKNFTKKRQVFNGKSMVFYKEFD